MKHYNSFVPNLFLDLKDLQLYSWLVKHAESQLVNHWSDFFGECSCPWKHKQSAKQNLPRWLASEGSEPSGIDISRRRSRFYLLTKRSNYQNWYGYFQPLESFSKVSNRTYNHDPSYSFGHIPSQKFVWLYPFYTRHCNTRSSAWCALHAPW